MSVLVISYARSDQPIVRAIVHLLRGALRDLEKAVYWDDDFEPGEPWFEQIKAQIDVAPQLFVFWCVHSAQSTQVRREFEYAFLKGKRVVPVLLDRTKLCAELAELHGIDLRPLTEQMHARLGLDAEGFFLRKASRDDVASFGLEYSTATHPNYLRLSVILGLVIATILSRYITQPSIPLTVVVGLWVVGFLFLFLMRKTQIRTITTDDRRRQHEAEENVASQFAVFLSERLTCL